MTKPAVYGPTDTNIKRTQTKTDLFLDPMH